MGFVWESYFECPTCGASDKATAIEYDRLGYPVCPECELVSRPTRGQPLSEVRTETGA